MQEQDLKVRPFMKLTDYPMVKDWWEQRGWKPVGQVYLPIIGCFICDKEGKELAVGWMYLDSSSLVASIEWVLTNPKNNGKESYLSVKFLMKYLANIALAHKYDFIITSTNHNGLGKLFKRAGFAETDKEVTHYIYKGD